VIALTKKTEASKRKRERGREIEREREREREKEMEKEKKSQKKNTPLFPFMPQNLIFTLVLVSFISLSLHFKETHFSSSCPSSTLKYNH